MKATSWRDGRGPGYGPLPNGPGSPPLWRAMGLVVLAWGMPLPAEIRVPFDVPTIQDAIDMAQIGETILVYPGDYVLDEPLQVRYRCFTLRSVGGPEVTTIRMPSTKEEKLERILLRIVNPSPEDLVIEGFTFLVGHGQTAIAYAIESYAWKWKPFLIVRGNVFRHLWSNWAFFDILSRQRGIYIGGPGLFEENTFTGIFEAISVPGASSRLPDGIIVRRNCIRACYVGISVKGGIRGHPGLIEANTIEGCRVGIVAGPSTYSHNMIVDCTWGLHAVRGAAIEGNFILAKEHGVIISNGYQTEFRGNTIICSEGFAVRMARSREAVPVFDGNTIVYGKRGGFDVSDDIGIFRFILRNSILWPFPGAENAHPFFTYELSGPGRFPWTHDGWVEITASHSVIYGQPIEGPGLSGADPLFADLEGGDLRLLPGSPCIDAGDPESEPDPDGSRADIGAIPWDRGAPVFIRGDVDGNGRLDVGDAVGALGYLFAWQRPLCPKAGDFDDDGILELGDAVGLLRLLFAHGEFPAPPFPAAGEDETPDLLPCGP